VRLLVVQHDADKGLGLLGQPLLDAGVELYCRMAASDPLVLADHAAVVALPGLADPVDDTYAVVATRAVLRAALERDMPVLGICLGAELLAQAAGGAVRPCRAEYGYCRMRMEPAASQDPLLRGLPVELDAFQAHGFAFELPPGATPLARSDHALQAFRLGGRAWGLQFHPEPTLEMVGSWVPTIEASMRRNGVTPALTVRRAHEEVPRWAGWTSEIVAGFVGTVLSA
jgi:GMP synthase-like glutamine amidotransferase